MKRGLLLRTPALSDLQRMYYELAACGAPAVGVRARWPYRPASNDDLFALACEMLRYDARLLTVLVQWLHRKWSTFNPVHIRERMASMSSPQSVCVVSEFAKGAYRDQELRYFCDYLAAGWPRVQPAELFFLDAPAPGGKLAQRALGRNLREYAAWGFVGTERPTVDQATRRLAGHYSVAARRDIIGALLESRDALGLAEVLDALDHTVSRQQALADLRSVRAKVKGHGRGARWTLRSR